MMQDVVTLSGERPLRAVHPSSAKRRLGQHDTALTV